MEEVGERGRSDMCLPRGRLGASVQLGECNKRSAVLAKHGAGAENYFTINYHLGTQELLGYHPR